jgi:4-amino-4-deoxy-L-arabinose transferase-like glycosyltransferase
MLGKLRNLLYLYGFVLIFIVGFFLRYAHLSNIPSGLNPDEAAIGYNAYSILKTGKDEYGKLLPLYFRSFDDYKLPVYIYLTTASIKVFGMNEFAVRFPSMLFGSLSIVALYFLVLELSKKKNLAILASFLLAINPWHVFFSRAGFEVNVATSFALFGTWFFMLGIRKKINNPLLFLSIISFVISIYCYNVSRIVSLLIFCGLIILNWKIISKIPKYLLISFGLLFIAFLFPLITTLFSGSGLANQSGNFITGNIEKAKFIELRSYFIMFPDLFSKIFFNNLASIFLQYLRNIFGYFSFDFFFIRGTGQQISTVGNFGTFYFLELPFILTGFILGIKKKIAFLWPFYLWLIIVVLITSLTREVPHATRSFMIVIPMIVFSAYGCIEIIKYLLKQRKYIYTSLLISIYTIASIYLIINFFLVYFVYFPVRYAKDWREEDKKLVAFIRENEYKYDKIIFDKQTNFNYTTLLFYLNYPPEKYQNNAIYQKDGLLNLLSKVDKYEFRDIDWDRDFDMKNSVSILFVVSPSNTGGKGIMKTLYLPTRPIDVPANGIIVGYPYAEPIYLLLEKLKYENL